MDTIRPLTPEDAPAYAELRTMMLADTPWAFASSLEDDRGRDAQGVAKSLAAGTFAMFGAFTADGSLVSVAMLMRESKIKRRHIAWVMSVYTHPAHRGRGLGERVMAALVDAARAMLGVDSVYLGVSERAQAARRLYDRMGFVAWANEADAVRVDGVGYAETLMRLDLRSAGGRSGA
jgi:ribosomal protein S18 acetylase RimI-like enzyme